MNGSAQQLLSAWMRLAPNVLRFPVFRPTDQIELAAAAASRFGRIVHIDLDRGVARLERERP